MVFNLKMESVSKNTIFGLKMMVKSGLEKVILKSLHAGRWVFLVHNETLGKSLLFNEVRETINQHGGI